MITVEKLQNINDRIWRGQTKMSGGILEMRQEMGEWMPKEWKMERESERENSCVRKNEPFVPHATKDTNLINHPLLSWAICKLQIASITGRRAISVLLTHSKYQSPSTLVCGRLMAVGRRLGRQNSLNALLYGYVFGCEPELSCSVNHTPMICINKKC